MQQGVSDAAHAARVHKVIIGPDSAAGGVHGCTAPGDAAARDGASGVWVGGEQLHASHTILHHPDLLLWVCSSC